MELQTQVSDYSTKIEKLEVQAERVVELEKEVEVKEVEMVTLKEDISDALFDFEGKG